MDKTKQRQAFGSPASHHLFATKAQDKYLFQRSCLHAQLHVCVEALDLETENRNQELSWPPDITATMESNIFGH